MLRLFAIGVGISGGGMVLAFLLNLILARAVGPEEMGVYAEALAWHVLLATIGTAGADRLMVREIAHMRSVGCGNIVPKFVEIMATRTIRWSVVIGGVVAITWASKAHFEESVRYPLVLACFFAPLGSLLVFNISVLHGLQCSKIAQIPDQIVRPAIVMILVTLLWKINMLDGSLAVICYLFATVISLFFSRIMLKYSIQTFHDKNTTLGISASEIVRWNRSALTLTGAVVVHALSVRLDVVLLALFSDTFQVGLYHIANRVAVLSTVLLGLFNLLLGPRAANMLAEDHLLQLQRQTTMGVRAITIAMAPWFALIIFFPEIVLGLFGENYKASAPILQILAFANIVNIITGPAGTLLNAAKCEKDLLLSLVTGFVVLLFLSICLIPIYGAVGAAYAAGTSLATLNICAALLLQRTAGINATIFARIH